MYTRKYEQRIKNWDIIIINFLMNWASATSKLNDKINVLVLKSLHFFGNYHENLMEMSMNLCQRWVNSEQTYYTREHARKWTNHTLKFK